MTTIDERQLVADTALYHLIRLRQMIGDDHGRNRQRFQHWRLDVVVDEFFVRIPKSEHHDLTYRIVRLGKYEAAVEKLGKLVDELIRINVPWTSWPPMPRFEWGADPSTVPDRTATWTTATDTSRRAATTIRVTDSFTTHTLWTTVGDSPETAYFITIAANTLQSSSSFVETERAAQAIRTAMREAEIDAMTGAFYRNSARP